MTAESLNATLALHAPAAHACLSRLGREAVFPTGIPAQAVEAQDCRLQATVGQFTEGDGEAIVIQALDQLVDPPRRAAFLYSRPGGHPELRAEWLKRIRREGGDTPISLPLVTMGLTHGLSTVAELFGDEDCTFVYPRPSWGNYKLVFGARRGCRLASYDLFGEDGRYNVQGLQDCLQAVQGTKAIVLLGFPGNPSGFSPREEDAHLIVEALAAHRGVPLVVVCDDAYHGMVFQEGVLRRSLFWELTRALDPARGLAVKVDGCTKELLFFGGRVGFITFGVGPEAAQVLDNKVRTLHRGSINVPPGPTQVMATRALREPDLDAQIATAVERLAERAAILRTELDNLDHPALTPLPFNAGFFALVQCAPGLDVHKLRRRLITQYSTGVIAVPEINALRLAFCSIARRDIPALVDNIRQAADEELA
jgi:aspartate/methionine/tyrosine aminotransferase